MLLLKKKMIISFGLYGNNDKYLQGAINNVILAKTVFPGWICRFYCALSVPLAIKEDLRNLGAEIENVPNGVGATGPMFWRFLPAADKKVAAFIVRDADSRLNSRDSMAVLDWLTKSNKPVHIMRDHMNHCYSMNGGLWGARNNFLSWIGPQVKEVAYKDSSIYFDDMRFLNKHVWPKIQGEIYSHDSYCCDKFKGSNTHPFPTKRLPNLDYVGSVFNSLGNLVVHNVELLREQSAPMQCRGHKDWKFG